MRRVWMVGVCLSLQILTTTNHTISKTMIHMCKIVCASSILFHAELPALTEWTDRNRLVAETWRIVDRMYLDRTFNDQDWFKLRQDAVRHDYNTDEECYTAINAMLSKLGDKYTRYLTPTQYASVLNSAVGQLIGVGIEFAEEVVRGSVAVGNVEEGSPAHLAGIMKGDVLLYVDSVDTSKLSAEEVAGLLRGPGGSKVSITLRRGDSTQVITVVRQPLAVKSVSSVRLVPVPAVPGTAASGKASKVIVGYVKIRTFSSTTSSEVADALRELQRQATSKHSSIDALVLDLRDNGGGLLQGAVETANLFLKPGKIVVYVVSGTGGVSTRLTTAGGGLTPDFDIGTSSESSDSASNSIVNSIYVPVYALVNGNTASAAEVFAAALQENGRAKLAGSRTFGKGIVQSLQQLRQGGVVVTHARYETPSHRNINKVGIPVDNELTCLAESSTGATVSAVKTDKRLDACFSQLLQ